VLTGEHFIRLSGVDHRLELRETSEQIVVNIFTGLGPLDKHTQVIGALAQRLQKRPVLVETLTTLHDALGLCLVLPERRISDARFEFGQLSIELCFLKDASGVLSPAVAILCSA
jgi:hypothetical protein